MMSSDQEQTRVIPSIGEYSIRGYKNASVNRARLFRLDDLILTVGVVITLSTPSINQVLPAGLANIVGLALLVGALFDSVLRTGRISTRGVSLFSALVLVFYSWLVFVSITVATVPISAKALLDYTQAVLTAVAIVLMVRRLHVSVIEYGLVGWGIFVAIMYLLGWIHVEVSETTLTHYLHIGLPIGLALSLVLWRLLTADVKRIAHMIGSAGVCIFLLASLLNLRGRTPLIASIISVIIVLVIVGVKKHHTRLGKRSWLAIGLLAIGIVYIMRAGIEAVVITRIENLIANPESEVRLYIFRATIALIENNPMGYGVGFFETQTNISSYPHNIFLESAFVGGWIGALLCISIIVVSFHRGFQGVVRKDSDLATSVLVALYFFVTWNVSYSLSSSYVPMGALALMVATMNQSRERLRYRRE